jgi:hypothetical protein
MPDALTPTPLAAPVITRTPIQDDDGSGTTGTVLDNAWKQELYGQIDGLAAALASAATGPHKILSATHTDTTPATLVAGDLLAVDATAKLVRLAAGVPGRLLAMGGGATPLPGWATAGEWTVVPFNAANFASGGGMTWTVVAGGQITFQYTVINKTCIVIFDLTGTTAGTAGPAVTVALPVASLRSAFMPVWTTANGVANVSGASAAVYRDGTLGVNFPLGSIHVAGTLIYPVA